MELAALPDSGEQVWRDFAPVFHRLMADTPDNADGAEDLPYVILRTLLREPWQVYGVWRDGRLVGFTSVMVRDAGWSSIVTQNMEGNDAILASNRRLGFVPTLGKRDLAFDYA